MAEQIVGIMEGPDLEGLDVRTRAAFLSERRRLLDTFPDLVIVADDVIADGGKVACAGTSLPRTVRPIVECLFEA